MEVAYACDRFEAYTRAPQRVWFLIVSAAAFNTPLKGDRSDKRAIAFGIRLHESEVDDVVAGRVAPAKLAQERAMDDVALETATRRRSVQSARYARAVREAVLAVLTAGLGDTGRRPHVRLIHSQGERTPSATLRTPLCILKDRFHLLLCERADGTALALPMTCGGTAFLWSTRRPALCEDMTSHSKYHATDDRRQYVLAIPRTLRRGWTETRPITDADGALRLALTRRLRLYLLGFP